MSARGGRSSLGGTSTAFFATGRSDPAAGDKGMNATAHQRDNHISQPDSMAPPSLRVAEEESADAPQIVQVRRRRPSRTTAAGSSSAQSSHTLSGGRKSTRGETRPRRRPRGEMGPAAKAAEFAPDLREHQVARSDVSRPSHLSPPFGLPVSGSSSSGHLLPMTVLRAAATNGES